MLTFFEFGNFPQLQLLSLVAVLLVLLERATEARERLDQLEAAAARASLSEARFHAYANALLLSRYLNVERDSAAELYFRAYTSGSSRDWLSWNCLRFSLTEAISRLKCYLKITALTITNIGHRTHWIFSLLMLCRSWLYRITCTKRSRNPTPRFEAAKSIELPSSRWQQIFISSRLRAFVWGS